MTAPKRVIVRVSAVLDARVKRVLAELLAASKKTSQAIAAEEGKQAKAGATARARAAKDGAKAVEGSLKEEAKEAESTAKEEERAAQRAERAKERLAEQSMRAAMRAAAATRREAEKTGRAQIREAQKVAKEQSRLESRRAQTARRFIAGAAGAAYGAVRGGLELVGRGQSVAGVGSLEERLGVAQQFRQDLIVAANEAKVYGAERKKIEENVLQASEETGISLTDLSKGLLDAQQNFDRFAQFGAIIKDIARVAVGKSVPVADLINVMGAATTGLNLEDEDKQRKFLDMLISTSERGSIEAGAVSRDIGPLMPMFSMRTGRTGLDAGAELLALAQTLGKAQPGQSGEVATEIERFLLEISDIDTQKKLKMAGVEVTRGGKIGGQLKDFGEIGALMNAAPQFQKPAVRQATFQRVEAVKAAEFLMAALQSDPNAFLNFQTMPEGEGLASAGRGMASLNEDPLHRLSLIGSHAQAETVRDADRIAKAITPSVEALTKLELRFPLLTASMGTLETTIKGAIAALVANGIINGAVGGAGLAKAGGALGTAGGVLGKAGILGATFGAAYLGTKELLELTGADKAIEKWGASLASPDTGDSGAGKKLAATKHFGHVRPRGGEPAQKVESRAELHIVVDGPGRVARLQSDPGLETYVSTGSQGGPPL